MRTAVIVTAVIAVLAGDMQAQNRVCTPARKASAAELVKAANESQIQIRADAQYGRVQVAPLLWTIADLDQKRILTHHLGVWLNCIHYPSRGEDELDSYSVTVVDMRSGRRLASIGVFRGFRIHGG